ncbi:uncharacterized protein EAF01_010725 [Botrytis porri]|uniref:uncharacterized protein n=1 Tax=Botrytis porri TaxID=87229 RepID=UPI0019006810|nr:uncharacterized protein EAF01_010725 [Botrytis porri]KAF7890916.1 hypothetical protein EAF01_010725 [Botrytis porri]
MATTTEYRQRKQTDVVYHLLGNIPLNNEDIELFGKGTFKSIKPKVKEQVDMMELVGHRDTITHEKIITNNPSLHEKKNLMFEERVKDMKADIEELKRTSEGSKRTSEELKRALEEWKRASEESKIVAEESKIVADQRIEMLEREKQKRYEGETANMRKQLWRMVFAKKEHKQKISEPEWMKIARKGRNHLAHQTDLGAVMKLADDHPEFYDILLDTMYGVPKHEIKLLLEADKAGENQVYNILNDRGTAFHNRYANACVEPFNSWLSAVRSLRDIQSATTKKSFFDYESCVQKQRAEVRKSIRKWDAAFKVDKLKRDNRTKKCQEIIYKDYEDRNLLPLIWKFFGVQSK